MIEQAHQSEILSIIDEIEKSASVTQRSLSEKLGISLGKTNYLLNALAERGIIKLKRFKNSHNKIAYLYILTPKGIRQKLIITKKFLFIKIKEYGKLKREITLLRDKVQLGPQGKVSRGGRG